MPNAREARDTALAIITFLIRPSIFLVLGLGFGYLLGYTDAFRPGETLGLKASRVVYKVHPSSLSDGIRQRATAINDTIQAKAGLADIPPN
jgi:hypothetical protein